MNETIRSYKDLIAWRKAFALGLNIYRVTEQFPDHERYGLTSQLRRGGVSVASNIAEGYGRGSTQDYVRFLRVARGALYEIETQIMFAGQLAYLSADTAGSLLADADECSRVLGGLIASIDRS